MPKFIEGGSLGVGAWAIPKMARRTLTTVIVVIAIIAILSAMLTGCSNTPEERFEEWRSNSSVVTTEGAKILQEKVISLLKKNDVIVTDSYVSTDFMDGIPYITFVALVTGEDGTTKEVKSYSIETEYDGPIASAFGYNSDEISVYGDMLYIDSYFEYADYDLQGEEIVVTE